MFTQEVRTDVVDMIYRYFLPAEEETITTLKNRFRFLSFHLHVPLPEQLTFCYLRVYGV